MKRIFLPLRAERRPVLEASFRWSRPWYLILRRSGSLLKFLKCSFAASVSGIGSETRYAQESTLIYQERTWGRECALVKCARLGAGCMPELSTESGEDPGSKPHSAAQKHDHTTLMARLRKGCHERSSSRYSDETMYTACCRTRKHPRGFLPSH